MSWIQKNPVVRPSGKLEARIQDNIPPFLGLLNTVCKIR